VMRPEVQPPRSCSFSRAMAWRGHTSQDSNECLCAPRVLANGCRVRHRYELAGANWRATTPPFHLRLKLGEYWATSPILAKVELALNFREIQGSESMNEQRSATEYVGTTINDHPILTTEEVQQWFSRANCVAPSDAAESIAQMLNHCAFLFAQWKGTPELRASRRKNLSFLRIERIGEALRTLQTELPVLIGDTLKFSPGSRARGLVPVLALLDSVNLLAPGFQRYRPRGRGREPERWHNIARNLGLHITKIFKSSAGRRVGFGKPTSLGVAIMQSALAYLRVEKSPEAIVDAMRPKRTRNKKVRGGEIRPKSP
jgi:hypothetical protein